MEKDFWFTGPFRKKGPDEVADPQHVLGMVGPKADYVPVRIYGVSAPVASSSTEHEYDAGRVAVEPLAVSGVIYDSGNTFPATTGPVFARSEGSWRPIRPH